MHALYVLLTTNTCTHILTNIEIMSNIHTYIHNTHNKHTHILHT